MKKPLILDKEDIVIEILKHELCMQGDYYAGFYLDKEDIAHIKNVIRLLTGEDENDEK